MSKAIQMIISQEMYENDVIRAEVEKKVLAALPSNAAEYYLHWRCLASLENPLSTRWICALNYTEAVK